MTDKPTIAEHAGPFDPTKPYTYRDGRVARILCTDRCGTDSCVPIVSMTPDGVLYLHRLDGTNSYEEDDDDERANDLINTKPRIKGWVNVYPGGYSEHCASYLHETKKSADSTYSPDRIACIEIDVEEGEGLS